MEPATGESTDKGSQIGAGAGVQRDVEETVEDNWFPGGRRRTPTCNQTVMSV